MSLRGVEQRSNLPCLDCFAPFATTMFFVVFTISHLCRMLRLLLRYGNEEFRSNVYRTFNLNVSVMEKNNVLDNGKS